MLQDQEISAGTDGSYLGERHFRCPANKGLFVKLRNCRRDSRFPAPEMLLNQVERCNSVGRSSYHFKAILYYVKKLKKKKKAFFIKWHKLGLCVLIRAPLYPPKVSMGISHTKFLLPGDKVVLSSNFLLAIKNFSGV